MSIKEILLAALSKTEVDKFPFRFQLHCIVNDSLDIPDAVRKQNPNQIMFILSSELFPDMFYDYEKQIFSFYASFGGVRRQVLMNLANIGAIVDDLDNSTLVFGYLNDQAPTVEHQKTPQLPEPTKEAPRKDTPEALLTKKHLSLVWSK